MVILLTKPSTKCSIRELRRKALPVSQRVEIFGPSVWNQAELNLTLQSTAKDGNSAGPPRRDLWSFCIAQVESPCSCKKYLTSNRLPRNSLLCYKVLGLEFKSKPETQNSMTFTQDSFTLMVLTLY